jgi:hypothetical protein
MLDIAFQEAYCRDNKTSNQIIDRDFLEGAAEATKEKVKSPVIISHIEKHKESKPINIRSQRFHVGDSVVVYPQKKIGIVFRRADEKGEVGVQIQKKKEFISHKRLQLKAAASELYPEDYDFSIIFDSVANRKARHKMDKGYHPELAIVYEKEQLK